MLTFRRFENSRNVEMTGYSLCGIAELNEEGSRGVFSFDVAQLERLVVVNFNGVEERVSGTF